MAYNRIVSWNNNILLCKKQNKKLLYFFVLFAALAGPIRQGIHEFLIAVHLQTHASARLSTGNEYVVPLVSALYAKDIYDVDAATRFPHVLGDAVSILPQMKAEALRAE